MTTTLCGCLLPPGAEDDQRPLPLHEWHAGPVPDCVRHGFTHLIWSPTDPERAPRPKGGQADRAPHRTLGKTTAAEWQRRLVAHLADGEARTFNRMGIELFGLPANVLFTTPVNEALWDAVAVGEIEHTLTAPILFRRRGGGASNATV